MKPSDRGKNLIMRLGGVVCIGMVAMVASAVLVTRETHGFMAFVVSAAGMGIWIVAGIAILWLAGDFRQEGE